ncbi:MAG: glycosyltransferase, partial [Actinomycetota bacterium]|nr:glycosyltransferase [Actinomycetota bacterium]
GAAGIHYTTAAEQEHAERAGVQTRGFVVPLGVDAAEFSRPEPDTALPVGFPPEGPVITFLGRLTEKKRIDVLLRAFAELVASGSDATLAVAGPDSEGLRGRLEAASAALGLEGRVMFPGMVLGTAKVAPLQRSDLFVLPSEDESFGVSVLEAMAAGVPVIVSPGVALHPVVTEYQAGLVAPTEAGALCRAMATILTDRDLAQQMGANGRSLAARQFSWESVGEGLEAMYGQALESSPVVTRTPR